MSVDDTGNEGTAQLQATYIRARGERMRSELHVSAKIAVDKEAKATGELRIRLTGAFFDPTALDTAKAQKASLKGIVKRVLSGCTLERHPVVTPPADWFRAPWNPPTTQSLPGVRARHGGREHGTFKRGTQALRGAASESASVAAGGSRSPSDARQ